MIHLKSITVNDIPRLNRLLSSENPDDLLSEVMEPDLVTALGKDLKYNIYCIAKDLLDKAVDDCIHEKIGIRRIPDGTKAKLFRALSETAGPGTPVTIVSSTRFDHGDFGQGWYSYNVQTESGGQLIAYAWELDI